MKNDNPLSPHIQIYNWHISSLVSISHRITGIINFVSLTLICFWVSYLVLGKDNYELVFVFLNSFFGKFLILGIVWSFSFQILSEIRHLFWDYGIGFELKTANITGSLVIVGSFILTILILSFAIFRDLGGSRKVDNYQKYWSIFPLLILSPLKLMASRQSTMSVLPRHAALKYSMVFQEACYRASPVWKLVARP